MLPIMCSYLVLSTILNFSVLIVSSLDPNSDLSLAFSPTDSFPQDTGLLWNQADELSTTQPTSLFDQAELSEGSEFYTSDAPGLTSLSVYPDELSYDLVNSFLNQSPPLLDDQSPPLLDVSTSTGGPESHLDDVFDSLFDSDMNSKADETDLVPLSDQTLFDDSFKFADCATSDPVAPMGKKSRIKRLDDPESCKTPTTTPPTGAETLPGGGDDETVELPDIMTILNNPYFLRRFGAARRNRDHNQYCYLFSEGILPWGVCSSGNPDDQRTLSERLHLTTIGFFVAYELNHCTLGMSSHPNMYGTSMYTSKR